MVCPASLVYNWTAELERFAPSLDVCAIVGAKAQRRVQIAGVAEHNVVVTSYDLMRRDIDEYVEQDFARVVLDEAQYIKNPLTQVARAAKRLPAGVRCPDGHAHRKPPVRALEHLRLFDAGPFGDARVVCQAL